jgi:hypothetical protein
MMRPILFLDFDDVICLNEPYGGYDVIAPESERPADLWQRLWHPPAVETLLAVVEAHKPHIVLTTSWLRLMDREGFEQLFAATGLEAVSSALHPSAWEAPGLREWGDTRNAAIERWLRTHHAGEPFAVVDDKLSGTGLRGSRLEREGAVVWCALGVGLNAGHLEQLRGRLAPARPMER